MDRNFAIGARVKYLRVKKELTLKQLGELTGLSTGFLSQLERGLSATSVDALYKVADALDVEIASFFTRVARAPQDPVVHGFEQQYAQIGPGILESVASKDVMAFQYLPRMYQLMPSASGEAVPANMYSHAGEEFLYVLEGVLTLYMNNGEYTLYPGDSVQLHSSGGHNWLNRTNRVVRFIQINCPNPYHEQPMQPNSSSQF